MTSYLDSNSTGSQETADSTGSQETADSTGQEIQETEKQLSIIHNIIESKQSKIQSTVLSLISTGYDRQDEKLIQWIQEQPLTTSITPIQHIIEQYK